MVSLAILAANQIIGSFMPFHDLKQKIKTIEAEARRDVARAVRELSLKVREEPSLISSTCVVFAKSEASSLLREGVSKEEVLAAFISAMSRRVVSLLERIGIEKEFGITGGIAKNKGMIVRLERELGIKSLSPAIDPQIVGALGAALIARSIVEKKKRGS